MMRTTADLTIAEYATLHELEERERTAFTTCVYDNSPATRTARDRASAEVIALREQLGLDPTGHL